MSLKPSVCRKITISIPECTETCDERLDELERVVSEIEEDINVILVDDFPTEPQENIIYLVKNENGGYTFYQYGGTWRVIDAEFSNITSNGESIEPLQPATADRLGGVKIGSGITVYSDGTINADGGSGGGTMIVNMTFDDVEYSVDKTFAEITENFTNCLLVERGETYENLYVPSNYAYELNEIAFTQVHWEPTLPASRQTVGTQVIIHGDAEGQEVESVTTSPIGSSGTVPRIMTGESTEISLAAGSSAGGTNTITFQLPQNAIPLGLAGHRVRGVSGYGPAAVNPYVLEITSYDADTGRVVVGFSLFNGFSQATTVTLVVSLLYKSM